MGWTYSIHYMPVVIHLFFLSILAAISRLISGGAIPLKICNLSMGISFKHPVINLIELFNAVSTFFVCDDCRHTRHLYSPTK